MYEACYNLDIFIIFLCINRYISLFDYEWCWNASMECLSINHCKRYEDQWTLLNLLLNIYNVHIYMSSCNTII